VKFTNIIELSEKPLSLIDNKWAKLNTTELNENSEEKLKNNLANFENSKVKKLS
jgi:hypothetical protein